ncbi:hypothetical protein [Streptomyces sp. E5N91]
MITTSTAEAQISRRVVALTSGSREARRNVGSFSTRASASSAVGRM